MMPVAYRLRALERLTHRLGGSKRVSSPFNFFRYQRDDFMVIPGVPGGINIEQGFQGKVLDRMPRASAIAGKAPISGAT